ncbi:hypothetical protein [Spirochaeta dissipatitropha]
MTVTTKRRIESICRSLGPQERPAIVEPAEDGLYKIVEPEHDGLFELEQVGQMYQPIIIDDVPRG